MQEKKMFFLLGYFLHYLNFFANFFLANIIFHSLIYFFPSLLLTQLLRSESAIKASTIFWQKLHIRNDQHHPCDWKGEVTRSDKTFHIKRRNCAFHVDTIKLAFFSDFVPIKILQKTGVNLIRRHSEIQRFSFPEALKFNQRG